jgi:hypothetical protein
MKASFTKGVGQILNRLFYIFHSQSVKEINLVSDEIPVDDEIGTDRVTVFECASMQLDASQLKTPAK